MDSVRDTYDERLLKRAERAEDGLRAAQAAIQVERARAERAEQERDAARTALAERDRDLASAIEMRAAADGMRNAARADLAAITADMDAVLAERGRLTDRVTALEEALRPFAEKAGDFTDDEHFGILDGLSVEHLRAARAALEAK